MLTHFILEITPGGLIILPPTGGETEGGKGEMIFPEAGRGGGHRTETGKNAGGWREKQSADAAAEAGWGPSGGVRWGEKYTSTLGTINPERGNSVWPERLHGYPRVSLATHRCGLPRKLTLLRTRRVNVLVSSHYTRLRSQATLILCGL